jgi:3-deoxy-D-manno-octulosonate 8-phosphate phosphatase (KDO 8-P phosphatase)
MDVDGVLTDAGMYYAENGDELKKFNTRDGQGIALARELGIRTVILTGESTKLVTRRAEKLRIDHLRQGVRDKRAALIEILETEDIAPEQACYVGDDLNDLGVLEMVGLAIVVNDAMRRPRTLAHYVTAARGGEGAIREVCEMILDAQRGGC